MAPDQTEPVRLTAAAVEVSGAIEGGGRLAVHAESAVDAALVRGLRRLVAGSCTGGLAEVAELCVGDLHVLGRLEACGKIVVKGLLRCDPPANWTDKEGLPAIGDGCEASVHGRIEAEGVLFAGRQLVWSPRDQADAEAVLGRTTNLIVATQDDIECGLVVGSESRLSLAGRARVTVEADRRAAPGANCGVILSWSEGTWLNLEWTGAGELRVRCEHRSTTQTAGTDLPLPALRLGILDGDIKRTLRLMGARFAHLDVEAGAQTRLSVMAAEGKGPCEVERLVARGSGEFAVVGEVGTLTCANGGNRLPTVVLAGTRVIKATGRFSLRVEDPEGTPTGRAERDPNYLSGDPKNPPVLIGLSVDATDAVVVNVDPTGIPLGEVGVVGDVLWFEPRGRSLIKWAKRAAKRRTGDEAERKRSAEWIFRFASALESRPLSGSSWSATRWALARVTHAAAPSSTERWVRQGLRVLGYGYRAGPPAVCWLAAALGCWAGLTICGPLEFTWSWEGICESFRDFIAVAVLPLGSLLRLGADNGLIEKLKGLSRLVVVLVVALPLASAIAGLRSQLRQPHPAKQITAENR